MFFEDIVGRRYYRLTPPRSDPDVWTPGERVEEWATWYISYRSKWLYPRTDVRHVHISDPNR
jgi:hypothetical protein